MSCTTIAGCTIRRATNQDAAELARLITSLGHKTTAEAAAERWPVWRGAGNIALVAGKTDGTLAGVATLSRMFVLHRPKPVGRITALVVDARWRGKGIGRALVAAAEEALAHEGCGLLEITSHLRLAEAHEFYKHLGFRPTSVRFAKDVASSHGERSANT